MWFTQLLTVTLRAEFAPQFQSSVCSFVSKYLIVYMCDACFFAFWLRVKGEQCPNPFLSLIIVLAQEELSVNHLHPLATSLAWGLTQCALSFPVVCLCCNIIYCHVAAKAHPCHSPLSQCHFRGVERQDLIQLPTWCRVTAHSQQSCSSAPTGMLAVRLGRREGRTRRWVCGSKINKP